MNYVHKLFLMHTYVFSAIFDFFCCQNNSFRFEFMNTHLSKHERELKLVDQL